MSDNQTIDLDGDLYTAIVNAIEDVIEDNREVLKANCKKAAQSAKKELQKNSAKNTGKYRRGWSYKVEEDDTGIRAVVYQKAKPSLTHLLEKGHATRNGGRVSGDGVIKDAYEKTAEQFKPKQSEV